ncbi:MAG: hypothetical protein K0Q76_673 [Panacagrimonas sp.]|jgi:hypothetical protein|nr:hypothetical protein [Panacagrimonas sp.]
MDTRADIAFAPRRTAPGPECSGANDEWDDPMSPASLAEVTMVYVRRDASGQIVSVSREANAEHGECCPADRPDVALFIQRLAPRQAAMLESDLSLIRALEDLIDVLIRKDVLRLTDLPDSVQAKLLSRRRLRGSLNSLQLLGDDEETF